jgi:hypothetical protein
MKKVIFAFMVAIVIVLQGCVEESVVAPQGATTDDSGSVTLEVESEDSDTTLEADFDSVEDKYSLSVTPKTLYTYSNILSDDSMLLERQFESSDGSTFALKSEPANGTASVSSDGVVKYLPDFGFSGTDEFVLTIRSSEGEEKDFTIEAKAISLIGLTRDVATTGATLTTDKNGMEVTDGSIHDDGEMQRGEERDFVRSNGIVYDALSGLSWQDDGENLRDKSTTVKDANTGQQTHKYRLTLMTHEEAVSYCDELTLGGHDDWRLPSELEMRTLIDYGREGESSIELALGLETLFSLGKTKVKEGSFENIAPDYNSGFSQVESYYFTTTKEAGQYATYYGNYRVISLTTGYGEAKYDGASAGAMCVRGTYQKDGFYLLDDEKEVLVDLSTKLMWQNGESYTHKYRYPHRSTTTSLQEGIAYCEDLTHGGYDDWVLPNLNELVTLTKESNDEKVLAATDDGEVYGARSIHTRRYLSSTSARFSANDQSSFFYYDDLTAANLHANNDNYFENHYTGSADVGVKLVTYFPFDHDLLDASGSSYMYGGVDWKECNKAEFVEPDDGAIYYAGHVNEQTALNYDASNPSFNAGCRQAGADYCKAILMDSDANKDISSALYCRTTSTGNDYGLILESLHGNTFDNPSDTRNADIRCIRKAKESDIEAIYNKVKVANF